MRLVYFVYVFFIFMSCSMLNQDSEEDRLTMQRIPYTGNNLKIDGFYYQVWQDDDEMRFSNVTFLYENGILLDIGGGGLLSEIGAFVQQNMNFDYSNHRGFWGVFHIHNNSIKWEKYYTSQTGVKVFRYEGEILTDTTFVMKNYSRIKNGYKQEANTIENKYHFKAFSPKPSSENDFIK